MSQTTSYPDFIKDFPRADVPMEGVQAYLLNQPGVGQAVFFDLPAGMVLPQHSHDAQWGIVIDGELDFNLEGDIQRRKKGRFLLHPQGSGARRYHNHRRKGAGGVCGGTLEAKGLTGRGRHKPPQKRAGPMARPFIFDAFRLRCRSHVQGIKVECRSNP